MNVDNILEYQRKVIKYANSNNKKGILLFHGPQDNTILTSILLSLTLYNTSNKKKDSSILVITSSMNIHRYVNYIRILKLDINSFYFLNYKQFNYIIKSNVNYCKDKIVIIDKVHYYRNPSDLTDNIIANLSVSLYNILISSSVLINSTTDIITIIAILHRISWESAKTLYTKAKDNKNYFNEIFQGYISHHSLTPSEEKKQLKVYENNITVPYSEKDFADYLPIEHWFLSEKEHGEYKSSPKKSKVSVNSKEKGQEKKKNKFIQFMLDFKTTVNDKVKDENKIAWILNKLTSQFEEKKNKTIIYFSKDSDKIHFINEFNKYNLQYININSTMSYEEQKAGIQRFNKSKIYILILSSINTDISWFIPNVRNLIVFEPQFDNSKIFSLIDDLISSYKYDNKNKDSKKSSTKRLDIYTLISKKPQKTVGVLSFVKNIFKINKIDTIDELINKKNEKSKLPIKIYKKMLKNISI